MVKKDTIIRTVVLGLAIANDFLALAGKSPLPFSDETVTKVVSFAFMTAASLVAWWKNNSFTEKAILADEYLEELREEEEQ